MLRTALLFFCLLALASAASARGQHTPAGLRNQRLTRGNFTPVYKTYRYHSHQDRDLFSFLHFRRNHPAAVKHRPRAHSSRKHTTGIF